MPIVQSSRGSARLEGERMGQCGAVLLLPRACVELDFAHGVVVFILKGAVLFGMLIQLIGNAHVIKAVPPNLFKLTLPPPALRLKPVAALAAPERCLGKVLELEPPPQRAFDLFEEVDVPNGAQVTGVVFVEDGDIEVLGVVAY